MLTKPRSLVSLVCLLAILLTIPSPTQVSASTMTFVTRDDSGAYSLASAMIANPATLNAAHFVTVPPLGTPHAVSDALSFFPTDGSTFGILTTGNADFADAPNGNGGTGVNVGGPATAHGSTAFDVTVLRLDLTVPASANCLRFDFAFYSEEFPEFVHQPFNDAFVAELDQTTWTANSTINAPNNFAFDGQGQVVSIHSTGITSMNALNASGTTYDGSTTLLEAATTLTPGAHSLYLSIFDQGDHVYDSAAFIDNIRLETVSDPVTDCKPGAQQKRVPLIFIPGVSGSKLNNANGELWPQTNRVYNDTEDEFLLPLRLADDGVSPFDPADPAYTTITVGDIIRKETANVGWPGEGGVPYPVDVYEPTIKAFTDAGYPEGATCQANSTGLGAPDERIFPFPYDWRRDNELTATKLLECIDKVRQQTGSAQVDIIAHSMGGLITRAVLANPASVGKIRKVLTLGTPVLGATRLLGILEYQTPCFIEVRIWCLTNPEVVQQIITNAIPAYQTLPGRAFDQAQGAPVLIDRDTNGDGQVEGLQDYPKWSAIVAAHHNAAFIALGDAFHQHYDDLTLADPAVKYTRVVGSGIATPDKIREYNSCFLGIALTCKVVYDVIDAKDSAGGDETVPLHAADLYNPNTGFDLRNGYDNVYAPKVKHGELPTDPAVLAFVKAYFGVTASQQTASLMAFQIANSQSAALGQATVSASTFGLSDTPVPFGGIELVTIGGVRGFISDDAGQVVGRNVVPVPGDAIVKTIPGGDYNAIADTQSFFLNNDGTYQGAFRVVSAGPIGVRVRTYADNQRDGQAIFNLDVPLGATLQIAFATGQDLSSLRLRVDRESDGVVDVEAAPDTVVTGQDARDTQAPTTVATTEAVDAQHGRVMLSAQDESDGSGVAGIYYLVPGSSAPATAYTGPLTLPLGAVVQFMAVDRAGNTEQPQELTVQRVIPLSVGPNTAPVNPTPVQTPINVSAQFTDSAGLDPHTALWEWGDGSTTPGAVTESNGAGTVTGNHTYTAAGIYQVKLTVTNRNNTTAEGLFQYLVVYNPNGGFVTGGGWFTSPVGAYPANPALTGKTNFGFNVRYQQGSTIPSGQTQISFSAANLDFHSTSYQWLVVAGAKAQAQGSGTINNSGTYKFLLTVIDGQIQGGGGTDKMRIKIWNSTTGGVIYDNQMGAADNADPVRVLEGGSIKIH